MNGNTAYRDDGKKAQIGLEHQAKQWPSPASRDYRSPNSEESQERRNEGSKRGQQLPNFVADLSRSSPQAPAIPAGSRSSETRRTLNPLFVEWLQGWPLNWTLADPRSPFEFPRPPSTSPAPSGGASTGLEPAETGLSRWLQRMRGELSMLLCGLSEQRASGSLL
jgi:hypothetical protein